MSIFRYPIEKIVEGYFFVKIFIYVNQERYEESLGDAHLEALSGHYTKSSMTAGGGGAGRRACCATTRRSVRPCMHMLLMSRAAVGVRQVVSEPCWEEIRGFLHPIIYMYARCLYWFGPNVWPLIA